MSAVPGAVSAVPGAVSAVPGAPSTDSPDLREILFFSDFPIRYHNPEAEEKMARFCERGYRVHYVERLGVRNPRPRHWTRITRALRATPAPGARPFDVVSPKLLFPRHLAGVDRVNRRWLGRQLLAAVDDPGETVFWIRYPTPELAPLLESQAWGLVVYELVDEHAHPAHLPPRLASLLADFERSILERAGVVFAWSEPIRRRLAALRDDVRLAPPAVDLGAFAGAQLGTEPAERLAVYAGSFDDRLDGRLMVEVVRRLRDWTFVFAGELTNPHAAELEALPNFRALGPVPRHDVPAILGGASVCLMPYAVTPVNDTLFPIKLVEYLAAGRPVVATPIRAAHDYADVVSIADDAERFAAAVVASADRDAPEARRERLARVEGFSWERRIEEMDEAIKAAASNPSGEPAALRRGRAGLGVAATIGGV